MKTPHVIVWGFRKDYEGQESGNPIASHAYIHAGYVRAFRAMGCDVDWVDDVAGAAAMVKADDVIFVMDTRSEHVPIRGDVFYITHNCHMEKFQDMPPSIRLGLQVYTKDATGEQLNPCTFYSSNSDGRTLFQPWGTDLLPDEFTYDPVVPPGNIVNWVGSIWACDFNRGNVNEINELEDALESWDVKMIQHRCLDHEHAELIRDSAIAPAVQGRWQCEVNYIPCRLFKNVSYGQMAISNNPISELLMPSIYSKDIGVMIDMAMAVDVKSRMDMTREAMEIVKKQHTYLARARVVIDCLFDR